MIILRRFCGPPDSGNGGYSAGLLAGHLQGVVEVTLRRPPPLERELSVEVAGEQVALKDGELLVAEARPATLDFEPGPAPSFEQATELSRHYVGHTRHHFPGCFVCGPARAAGDGLCIFPGTEAPGSQPMAPFVPPADLVAADGNVRPEVVWAALDCVGYFAIAEPDYPVALLGRMTVELCGSVAAGERCVVVGQALAREGRKLHAGTAIYGHDGSLRGRARQTWITLP